MTITQREFNRGQSFLAKQTKDSAMCGGPTCKENLPQGKEIIVVRAKVDGLFDEFFYFCSLKCKNAFHATLG